MSDICRVLLVRRLATLVIESTHGFPSGPRTTPLGSVFFSFSCCSTRWSCSGEASKGWGGNPVVISTAQRKRDRTGRYSSVMGISPSPSFSYLPPSSCGLFGPITKPGSDCSLCLPSPGLVNEVTRLCGSNRDGISGFGRDAGDVEAKT
jgi:hypothetical protein